MSLSLSHYCFYLLSNIHVPCVLISSVGTHFLGTDRVYVKVDRVLNLHSFMGLPDRRSG